MSYEGEKHKVLLTGVQRVRITQFGGFQKYLTDKKGMKYFKGQEEVHQWVRNSEYLRKGNHTHSHKIEKDGYVFKAMIRKPL